MFALSEGRSRSRPPANDLIMSQARGGDVGIAIVGAGLSGTIAALTLTEAGREDFTVLERDARPGGVWRDNRYPGAAADVPLQSYAPLIASYAGSTRQGYPTQPEMMALIADALQRSGAIERICFGADVRCVRWQDENRRWDVHSSLGTHRAKTVILAPGALRPRQTVDLDGIDDFEGAFVRSTAWPITLDLHAKRVAVVGSGPTAAQIVAAIVDDVSELHVLQRTARWVLPRLPMVYFAGERRHQAVTERVGTGGQRKRRRGRPAGVAESPAALRRLSALEDHASVLVSRLAGGVASVASQAWLRMNVRDSTVRKLIVPDYAFGCRRPVFSSSYLRALARPNVCVVAAAALQADQTGVIADDGTHIAVDVIIQATGFDYNLSLAHITFGEGDVDLGSTWQRSGGPFLGVSTPGFPNLYTLGHVGARTLAPIGRVAEAQMGYILKALEHLARSGSDYQVVSREAHGSQVAAAANRFRRAPWKLAACIGATDFPPEDIELFGYPGSGRKQFALLSRYNASHYREHPVDVRR